MKLTVKQLKQVIKEAAAMGDMASVISDLEACLSARIDRRAEDRASLPRKTKPVDSGESRLDFSYSEIKRIENAAIESVKRLFGLTNDAKAIIVDIKDAAYEAGEGYDPSLTLANDKFIMSKGAAFIRLLKKASSGPSAINPKSQPTVTDESVFEKFLKDRIRHRIAKPSDPDGLKLWLAKDAIYQYRLLQPYEDPIGVRIPKGFDDDDISTSAFDSINAIISRVVESRLEGKP